MVKAVILRPTADGLAYFVHPDDGGTAVAVPVSLDTAAENIRLLADFLASEIHAEESFAEMAARLADSTAASISGARPSKLCECDVEIRDGLE
jgi:hypothetical protein